MTAVNPITGDLLKSKGATDAYREGWDRIFGKKEEVQPVVQQEQTKKGHDLVQNKQRRRAADK